MCSRCKAKIGGIDMNRGLYVGRFQPFHTAHLEVIKFMDEDESIDEILIGIGSSQYDHENKSLVEAWKRNPFTFEERKEMVEKSVEEIVTKQVSIYPIPDLHDYDKWFESLKDIFPEFYRVYTPSESEREYFEQRGFESSDFPRFKHVSGTDIRHRMHNGLSVVEYVPAGTLKVLERIEGNARVKQVYDKDLLEVLMTA